MKNKAVKVGIVASLLPHLFCCVLPVVLGIIGMVAPDFADHDIVPESAEMWLFVFSGLMLILSWIMYFNHDACKCDHCNETHHHRKQKIFLLCITVFTIGGIVMHLISHH